MSSPLTAPQLIVGLAIATLVISTPVLTSRLKKPGLAAVPVCIALLLLVVGSGWKLGGLEAPAAGILPLLPLVAYCFGGRHLALASLAGSLMAALGLFVAGSFDLVVKIQDVENQARHVAIVYSLLSVAAFMIGSIYERSRRIAERHLVEASRLASLGVMAGGVAHEINNPLMIADSFARFLVDQAQRGPVDPREVERLASHVVTSTTRMAAIVAGLRVYSRDDARDELAEVSMERIVEDALTICRERFKSAGITLRIGAIPPHAVVMARPVQLGQVLLNVLNNAYDAATCSIRVADSGTGVPEAVRPQIFIPFYTTKPIGKGVGLGLSVSASIMAEHGGEILLDERRPRTTFVIRLPSVSPSASKRAA